MQEKSEQPKPEGASIALMIGRPVSSPKKREEEAGKPAPKLREACEGMSKRLGGEMLRYLKEDDAEGIAKTFDRMFQLYELKKARTRRGGR